MDVWSHRGREWVWTRTAVMIDIFPEVVPYYGP